MRKTTFPPGPYFREGARVYSLAGEAHWSAVVEPWDAVDRGAVVAVATLFRAAPDLYARVAAHAAQCGACGGTGTPNRMSAMDDSRAPDGSCSVCYEDRQALAKARGETP